MLVHSVAFGHVLNSHTPGLCNSMQTTIMQRYPILIRLSRYKMESQALWIQREKLWCCISWTLLRLRLLTRSVAAIDKNCER